MHEGDVCEGVCAKGVAHGDERARGADGVDEVGDVAGVVEPGGCFYVLVEAYEDEMCKHTVIA